MMGNQMAQYVMGAEEKDTQRLSASELETKEQIPLPGISPGIRRKPLPELSTSAEIMKPTELVQEALDAQHQPPVPMAAFMLLQPNQTHAEMGTDPDPTSSSELPTAITHNSEILAANPTTNHSQHDSGELTVDRIQAAEDQAQVDAELQQLEAEEARIRERKSQLISLGMSNK
jgi:hypothetical protein